MRKGFQYREKKDGEEKMTEVVSDVLGRYCGEFTIKLKDRDGNPSILEIKPKIEHYRKLKRLQEKSAKKGVDGAEDISDQQLDLFKEILLDSVHPDYKTYAIEKKKEADESVEWFLMQNELEFTLQLYVAFGWLNDKQAEEIKKKVERNLMNPKEETGS